MKLYRVTVTRRTEREADGQDEFYVTASSSESALAAVGAELGNQKASRVAGWNVELVSNRVVRGA